jgi:hypothetical protein
LADFLCKTGQNPKWLALGEPRSKNPEIPLWQLPIYIHSHGQIARAKLKLLTLLGQATVQGLIQKIFAHKEKNALRSRGPDLQTIQH